MTDHTLSELADRIDTLEQRVEALDAKIQTNETKTDGTLDNYDASVLSELDPGDTVTLNSLQTKYQRAGIVQKRTIQQRVKRLTNMPYFEGVGHGRWRFTGRENGDGDE